MRSIRSLVLGSTVLCTTALAQSISPSNSTDDFPRDTYPHFTVTPASSVRFPSFEIVPLAQYVAISRAYFVNVNLKSMLVAIDPQNVQQLRTNDFLYVSCDREDYTGELSPAQLLTLISGISSKSQVIFYTRRGIHCEPAGYMSSHLPKLTGVWTTLDPVIAGQVADRHFSHATDATATITAVQDTYTNPDSTFYTTGSLTYNPASSTAVAMIVLYTITGLITTLFVGIIVTGAIRAHLHPERYGPRARTNLHGRQSRAKGIARAVLETIPIVKFGDQHKDNLEKSHDMEMEVSVSDRKESKSNDTKGPTTATVPRPEKPEPISPSSPNADGTDELGALGCSICTEEFKQGEELRVLPCNHKYHPDCVDPWLLNVSGTCPLCRIDLRQPEDDTVNVDPIMLIPASTGNLLALRSVTSGSRDERIAALRLFRAERSTRGENLRNQNEEERTSLARRLRDRFRIRTREHRTHHEATE